jgi:hypothetical protein
MEAFRLMVQIFLYICSIFQVCEHYKDYALDKPQEILWDQGLLRPNNFDWVLLLDNEAVMIREFLAKATSRTTAARNPYIVMKLEVSS